jgi:hypothetical protein
MLERPFAAPDPKWSPDEFLDRSLMIIEEDIVPRRCCECQAMVPRNIFHAHLHSLMTDNKLALRVKGFDLKPPVF